MALRTFTGGGPRERLARHGAESLGNAELLAVLLGSGHRGQTALEVAGRTLRAAGDLRSVATATVAELCLARGLGPAKAARIAAAAEFGRRVASVHPFRGPSIERSADVVRLVGPKMRASDVELFLGLPLDARNRPLGELLIAKGGLTHCTVSPADAFRPLLRCGAASVIFVHNHPSGRAEPSAEDIELTRRLCAAGELLGLPVLDHVVVGWENHASLADLKLMPVPQLMVP
ncbi:MAG: DNA repair protein RadC [Myxococcota bacterium]